MPRLLPALIVALLLCACTTPHDPWRQQPLTHLDPGTVVTLRVLRADNPRLPRMTDAQIQTLLAVTQRTVQTHFGVTLRFSVVEETDVAQLFARLPPRVRAARATSIYDFKYGHGDPQRIAQGLLATLRTHGTTLDEAYAYAQPYLPAATRPDSLRTFSAQLTDVMLKRLQAWRTLPAPDGRPVLDDTPYNEWIDWDTLGYGELQYDIVITNQLIASAEDDGVDIHTAIRGGLTVGTTTYSRQGRYGSFVFWSTFPFTDDSALTAELRGGERYTPQEAAELSGAYLAHEIGHLLFRFGHPFARPACVMDPVRMLRFRAWQQGLDATHCRIGSSPEMRPGAIPETYHKDWLRLAQ